MCITVISLIYNESAMLPHFVAHYRHFFDNPQIVLIDDSSTDESKALAQSLDCQVIDFCSSPSALLEAKNDQINQIWKSFRNSDWIIIADMDELIFHPCLKEIMDSAKNAGCSIIETRGYEMFAEETEEGRLLVEQIKTGIPKADYNKPVVFDPQLIGDMNFIPGQHWCRPSGQVRFAADKLLLLHYKYIRPIDQIVHKYQEYRQKYGIGGYLFSEAQIRNYYEGLKIVPKFNCFYYARNQKMA